MKTRDEVEDLKIQWEEDPCWDLFATEGFEEYQEELRAHQDKMEAYWQQSREEEKRDRAHRMGLKHPSKLADYISGVEWRMDQLVLRIDQLETRNDDLQRRLDYLERTSRSLI